jgi:hypothetical protein
VFFIMIVLYTIVFNLSIPIEQFSGNISSILCPSKHGIPTYNVNVSRANCTVLNVADESC